MPQLAAISHERFSTKAWKHSTSYVYAAQANIIHVVAAELAHLVPAMALGFVQTRNTFELVALQANR